MRRKLSRKSRLRILQALQDIDRMYLARWGYYDIPIGLIDIPGERERITSRLGKVRAW